MELNNLKKLKSFENKMKRVGRGGGSGKGWHTTGRGTKGQKARDGRTIPFGFEGGQSQMFKKMPQMGGFSNEGAKKRILDLPLTVLNVFEEGSTVSMIELRKSNLVNKGYRGKIKFLDGDLKKKLNLKGFLFSAIAKEKAEKAGATLVNA